MIRRCLGPNLRHDLTPNSTAKKPRQHQRLATSHARAKMREPRCSYRSHSDQPHHKNGILQKPERTACIRSKWGKWVFVLMLWHDGNRRWHISTLRQRPQGERQQSNGAVWPSNDLKSII